MTFKEKLVKLRKLKKITQDEFACAVGVSRQAVYKWESGQSYPEVPKLIEMKHLFGISIDDLLDDNYEVILPEKKKRKRRTPAEMAAARAAEAAKNGEAVPAPVTPAPVVETPAVEEVPAVETVVEAPVVEEVPAVETVVETPAADTSNDDAKKKGFFGKLFGRK